MSWEYSQAYKAYIASPQWNTLCAKYWANYGKKCQACSSTRELQVHHKSYERFGRELLGDLCGLCATCHRKVHAIHRRNRRISLRAVTDRYVISTRINNANSG